MNGCDRYCHDPGRRTSEPSPRPTAKVWLTTHKRLAVYACCLKGDSTRKKQTFLQSTVAKFDVIQLCWEINSYVR